MWPIKEKDGGLCIQVCGRNVAHWQSQEREGERVSVAICIQTGQMFPVILKMPQYYTLFIVFKSPQTDPAPQRLAQSLEKLLVRVGETSSKMTDF